MSKAGFVASSMLTFSSTSTSSTKITVSTNSPTQERHTNVQVNRNGPFGKTMAELFPGLGSESLPTQVQIEAARGIFRFAPGSTKRGDNSLAAAYHSSPPPSHPTRKQYLAGPATSSTNLPISTQSSPTTIPDLASKSPRKPLTTEAEGILVLITTQLDSGLTVSAKLNLEILLKLACTNPRVQEQRNRFNRIIQKVERVQQERNSKNWNATLLAVERLGREVTQPPREWFNWRLEGLVGMQDYNQAGLLATSLLEINSNDPDALYYLGLCYYVSGQHAAAIRNLQNALRNDPDLAKARTLLNKVKLLNKLRNESNILFKSGQKLQALEKVLEAIQIDREYFLIHKTMQLELAVIEKIRVMRSG